jgi:hypothetical protein
MKRLLPRLLATALLLAPGSALAETYALGYDVYVGGVRLGRMTLETEREGDAYRVGVGAKPNDLINALVKWSYAAESSGAIGGPAGVTPQRFEARRSARGRDWSTGLEYGPGGAVTPRWDPAPSEEDATAVPPDQRTGTIDLLSASAVLSLAAEAQGGSCAARVPVYDGRRRFDVVGVPAGKRRIEKSDYTVFEGEAWGCRVEIHPVAGFRKAKGKGDDFWTVAPDGKPRSFMLWLARPDADGPVVPVRLEAKEVFYANILGHLVSVERREGASAEASR